MVKKNEEKKFGNKVPDLQMQLLLNGGSVLGVMRGVL
jgi:hypothetical protein